MHFVRSSHFVRGSKGTSVVLKARLDAYRYASASVIPDGAPHGRPVYHFDKVSYLLTPSNRSQFLQKNIVPFLSVGSLKAMEAFQGRCLDKINTLTIDTPYHALPLYRLLHATQNDISKALIHQYASQAWNMDFFLSTLLQTPGEIGQRDNTPSAELQGILGGSFGSFDRFKELFSQVANGYFGAGWVWLVKDNNKQELSLKVTHHGGSSFVFPNATKLSGDHLALMTDETFVSTVVPEQYPILGLSLWEHSFLACHGAQREQYVDAFWTAVDWEKVHSRLL